MGWLKKLNLEMPDTLDDFYEVFTAFRDKDPNGNGRKDEIPMTGGANVMTNSLGIVSAAMGFPEPNGLSPVVINNQVSLFSVSPLYGDYLKYINRLYNEQLLDNDFYTNTAVMLMAKGSEDLVGVHTDSAPWTLAPEEKIWTEFTAFTPMTSQWNNTKMWLDEPEIVIGRFAITRACRYPEAAIRFGDFFFTEKGSVYQIFGPPKDHPDIMGMHTWVVF